MEVLVSVREMIANLLEDEFVLDRRLPRTLFGLLLKPGSLTVEYVNGRIARYIRPFKLYIVSSVIFFLLLSFLSLRMLAQAEFEPVVGSDTALADSVGVAALDSAIARIDSIRGELGGLAGAGLDLSRQALVQQRQQALSSAQATDPPERPPVPPSPSVGEQPRTVADLLQLESRDDPLLGFSFGVDAVDDAVARRLQTLGQMSPREATQTVIRDTLGYIPTMMFILLPVFALVLKLLYIRRRRFYAEHFVFLLHVHAFVYLIFTLLLLARGVFSLPGWLMALLLGWTMVYIYLAMLRVYGQGWLKTFVKYWVLSWTYVWILSFSVPVAFLIAFVLV